VRVRRSRRTLIINKANMGGSWERSRIIKLIFHFIYLGAVKGFGFVLAGRKLGHIPDHL